MGFREMEDCDLMIHVYDDYEINEDHSTFNSIKKQNTRILQTKAL